MRPDAAGGSAYAKCAAAGMPISRSEPVASFIGLDGMSVRSLPICRNELLPFLQVMIT
jgi:hypothetical protein